MNYILTLLLLVTTAAHACEVSLQDRVESIARKRIAGLYPHASPEERAKKVRDLTVKLLDDTTPIASPSFMPKILSTAKSA